MVSWARNIEKQTWSGIWQAKTILNHEALGEVRLCLWLTPSGLWGLYIAPGNWLSQLCESEVAQSCPTLCDPWTEAHQAPPSLGFSRQEYWSGLPFPSPGDLPNPGIEPRSPTLQADALTSAPPGKPLNTRIQSLRKPPIETQNFRSKY